MYGKIFASTFTGSMFGRGPVMFSVWAFVLAHTDQTGTVELNPRLVASSLGAELNEVELAIQELCRPDESSRNPADDGRRLLREGQFTYRVVSHAIYQRIRTQDDRREYNRQKQAESRARKKEQMSTLDKVDSQQKSALSAHIDIDVDIRNKKKEDQNHRATRSLTVKAPAPYSDHFERFWMVYPRKTGKGSAWKAFVALSGSAALVEAMCAALAWQVNQPQWTKDGGQFIPHAATWLRARRWEDEPFHAPIDTTPNRRDTLGVANAKAAADYLRRTQGPERPGQQRLVSNGE